MKTKLLLFGFIFLICISIAEATVEEWNTSINCTSIDSSKVFGCYDFGRSNTNITLAGTAAYDAPNEIIKVTGADAWGTNYWTQLAQGGQITSFNGTFSDNATEALIILTEMQMPISGQNRGTIATAAIREPPSFYLGEGSDSLFYFYERGNTASSIDFTDYTGGNIQLIQAWYGNNTVCVWFNETFSFCKSEADGAKGFLDDTLYMENYQSGQVTNWTKSIIYRRTIPFAASAGVPYPELTPIVIDVLNISNSSPSTQTYFTHFPSINFSVTVNSTETFNCSLNINGVEVSNVTYTAGTNVAVNATQTIGEGANTFFYRCATDYVTENSNIQTLTVVHPPISNGTASFERTIYEKGYTQLFLNLSDSYYNYTNPSLVWNATAYNVTRSLTGNLTILVGQNLSIPLVVLNNTNITHFWQYDVVHNNGTTLHTDFNSTVENQSVLFSYGVENFTYSATETESIVPARIFTLGVGANVTSYLNYGISNVTYFLSTPYVWTVPNLPPEWTPSVNTTLNYTLNVYDENTNLFRSFIWNFTVSELSLNNCSGLDKNVTFSFRFRDEKDLNYINASMDITIKTWINDSSVSKNNTFSFDNLPSYDICLYPAGVVRRADIVSHYLGDYENVSYNERQYIQNNLLLSDTVRNTTLYLLDEGNYTNIDIRVVDAQYNDLENYLVEMWKYYPATNEEFLVDTGITNYQGITPLGMDNPDSEYVFRFYDYDELRRVTTKATYSSLQTTFVFKIIDSITQPINDWVQLNQVQRTLNYSNTTGLLVFGWSDPSNVAHTYCLNLSYTNATPLYSACTEFNISHLSYLVNVSRNDTYIARAYVYMTDGKGFLVDVLGIDTVSFWRTLGRDGLFISILITLINAFVAITIGVEAAVISTILSLFMIYIFELAPVSISLISGVIVIAILGIVKLRKTE